MSANGGRRGVGRVWLGVFLAPLVLAGCQSANPKANARQDPVDQVLTRAAQDDPDIIPVSLGRRC